MIASGGSDSTRNGAIMTSDNGMHSSLAGGAESRYGLFYAPAALAVVALAFLPLFKDVVVRESSFAVLRYSYGTVFDMAGRPEGGPAVLGLIFLACLVVCLVAATLRPPRSAGLPVAIAILAAVIVLMLITKPGTATPTPALTGSGTAGLVLAIGIAALAIAHAIQLASRRDSDPGAVAAVPPAQSQEADAAKG
jgi:hypothetical protein